MPRGDMHGAKPATGACALFAQCLSRLRRSLTWGGVGGGHISRQPRMGKPLHSRHARKVEPPTPLKTPRPTRRGGHWHRKRGSGGGPLAPRTCSCGMAVWAHRRSSLSLLEPIEDLLRPVLFHTHSPVVWNMAFGGALPLFWCPPTGGATVHSPDLCNMACVGQEGGWQLR